MNRRLYAIHRWVSAIAFLQLAVWTASGTFFTLFDIADVRGRSVDGAHESTLPPNPGAISVTSALAVAAQHGVAEPAKLELRALPQGLFYVARGAHHAVRIDARTGARADVTADEAASVARRDQPGGPEVAERARVTSAETAYRGKPLPAWRVRMKDAAETDVYVDATTGDVTARRTRLWRTYDLLWSLHIMDYRDRESFHHPLIVGAALLALATVASGATLWAVRLARRFARRAVSAA
jgi:hypothetical protein